MSSQATSLEIIDAPDRYAVLLNARARGWTGEVHEAVQRFVPTCDLYLTDDFHQASTTVEKILEDDYDVVFTGGGDGTIIYLLNAIEEAIDDGVVSREEAPPVGVLKLGTGNAIATYVGSGPIIEDLQALHAGASLKVRRVPMVDDGEQLFPFGGFGWDADILNDYDGFKDLVQGTMFERLATGLKGYGFSVASRTIPKAFLEGSTPVTLINRGPKALKLDEQGQIVGEIGPDEVIYRGPIKITGPATIPYWGFNLRMFPYCNLREGMFELRYYRGSINWIVRHLPDFWRGNLPSELMGDWLVSEVEVEIADGAMSYQIAGDATGYRDRVVWSMADHPVPLAVPLR